MLGQVVVHAAEPLEHGLGCVVDVLKDGLLTVQWADLEVQDYHPHEVEDADAWERRTVDRLIAEAA